jgi:hypothetical protein
MKPLVFFRSRRREEEKNFPAPKTPKQLADERRNNLRRALAAVDTNDIITLTTMEFYDKQNVEALRDLSRTADRAADHLERGR